MYSTSASRVIVAENLLEDRSQVRGWHEADYLTVHWEQNRGPGASREFIDEVESSCTLL